MSHPIHPAPHPSPPSCLLPSLPKSSAYTSRVVAEGMSDLREGSWPLASLALVRGGISSRFEPHANCRARKRVSLLVSLFVTIICILPCRKCVVFVSRVSAWDAIAVVSSWGSSVDTWSKIPGQGNVNGTLSQLRNISFGKRSGGGGRRANECLILEPSEMIVIDYPDVQLMRPGQRASCNTMNLEKLMALEQDEITIRPGGRGALPLPPPITTPTTSARSRGSVGSSVRDGSDTSSAYSGSDTMCHSLQSSLEPDDVDLSGLTESAVDSDEEDLAESIESLAVRDAVRECLEKDPSERTEDDIDVLLEFTQRLRAFSNMTLAVRRAMCQAMAEVPLTRLLYLQRYFRFCCSRRGRHNPHEPWEELDSWSVIINGHVEVTQPDGSVHELHLGDSLPKRQNVMTKNSSSSASFGITPTMEKLYHQGVMRSKVDDCQFVCIRQTDYYRILHQGEENTRRHEEDGVLVLVTEQRPIDAGNRRGNIGTAERLMSQLVEVENNVDPTYVEDFLLTHRTFIDNPLQDEILHFSILGGYERGFGIFISKVEKGSKAEEVGLKRGDQILEVNGQSFDHMNHGRALEILRQTCHLSITVKSNLLAFKEMLQTPDNSPRQRRESHLTHEALMTATCPSIPTLHPP
ncbi:Rap guanine nucleotide exchange factor 2 [Penaeus vannamei]|uniref:Rap guanine nucleotide exchange factor 2 n=1 Tax=Penaeus vannamei TaxID=6689 RepID=A0A3R7PZ28_PENVA|nr:Rap guanine nucleotide exchange factor 2 [Penaeus vannamei]